MCRHGTAALNKDCRCSLAAGFVTLPDLDWLSAILLLTRLPLARYLNAVSEDYFNNRCAVGSLIQLLFQLTGIGQFGV